MYRPDIDGLRAVAVAAVVLFHAGVPGMSGGFVGVDIFFVLSGYLISGIILRGLRQEKFSLPDFYVRRINRIVPALLVILCATFALGWTFLFAREFPNLGKHMIGGSTFSSNFFFWKELGYFNLPDKPLLHLWSLAVEEQFYLLWPVTLLILWKTRRDVRWGLIAIIEISFVVNVWQVRHSGGMAAFYLPLSRFWEILSGSLLVQMEGSDDSAAAAWRRFVERHGSLVAAAGLGLLVLSLAVTKSGDLWPGVKAVIPVLGTVLVVAAGSRAWVNARILSRPALVGLGLVSYPLYLWHWPLLVFARIVNEGTPPPWVRAAIVTLALALAVATYRFVERPIRFGRRKRRSALRLLPGLAATAAIGAAAFYGVIDSRLEPSQKHTVARWGPDWEDPSTRVLDTLGFHFLGSRAADTTTVILYGDSHAQQYWPRVRALGLDNVSSKPRVMLVAGGDCPPMPETNHVGRDWAGREWRCDELNRFAFAYMMRPRVKTVVIAGYWERYLFDHETFLTSAPGSAPFKIGDPNAVKAFDLLGAQIGSLVKAGKSVYLILSNPTPETHLESGLPRRLAGFASGRPFPPMSRSRFVRNVAWSNAQLRRIAGESGAHILDPVETICDTVCPQVTRDGEPVFKDDNHLRAGFVARHAGFIDQAFVIR